jgi:hypothetical protein
LSELTPQVGFNQNAHSEGTGLITSVKYQFNSASEQTFSFPTPPPSEFTFTVLNNVIAQGNVPNFLRHITFHTTVNAQGETTTAVNNVRTECQ